MNIKYMPEKETKYESITCPKSIPYKMPANISRDDGYQLKFFTCDKNGKNSRNDVPTPGGYIYKFNDDENCTYTDRIVPHSRKEKWSDWSSKTKEFDDCKNFSFVSQKHDVTRLPESKEYLKDLKKIGMSDGIKDAESFNFTCKQNGGGDSHPWKLYKYTQDGTFDLGESPSSAWYDNNVAHVIDCKDLTFFQ